MNKPENERTSTNTSTDTSTDTGTGADRAWGTESARDTERDTTKEKRGVTPLSGKNTPTTEKTPAHGTTPYAPDGPATGTSTSGRGTADRTADKRERAGEFGGSAYGGTADRSSRGTTPDTGKTSAYESTRGDSAHNGTRDGGQFTAGDLGDGLIPASEAARLRAELQHAVGAFVDSPRQSVAEADTVLETAVARITASLTERRKAMRTHWEQNGANGNGANGSHQDGGDLDTEKWRVIMLDYRDTMERLLSA
ncbi:hypothetical protein [Streptomyces sp. NPDC049881]|uniref:hypothetical protein n=1 Tax=Streptomyces sp. NPDC049881 TaxID=3155778 RepID=UPI003443B285